MSKRDRPGFSLKDFLWVLYLWPGRWLARVVPVGVLRNAGRLLCPFVRWLLWPAWKQFPRQLAEYPALLEAAGKLRPLFEAHLANALQRSVDDLLMWRFPVERVVARHVVVGREHLEQALALKRGVLLLTGHFFANRLGKRFLSTQGWTVMSVRNRGFDDPRAGRWGARYLQPRYYGFLHEIIGDEADIHDRDCSLKILERLRRGGIVNLHVDFAVSRETVELPFLGTRNRFALAFLDIARIAGCPAIPMFCFGNSRGLTIEFHAPLKTDSLLSSEIMKSLAGTLEQQILAHPAEWEFTMRL